MKNRTVLIGLLFAATICSCQVETIDPGLPDRDCYRYEIEPVKSRYAQLDTASGEAFYTHWWEISAGNKPPTVSVVYNGVTVLEPWCNPYGTGWRVTPAIDPDTTTHTFLIGNCRFEIKYTWSE